VSRPVCQARDCGGNAAVTVLGYVLGVGEVNVRVCSGHADLFLDAADGACLDARLAIARKRT
jgi:hypothetical protein